MIQSGWGQASSGLFLCQKFRGKTLPKTTFCGKIIKYCRRSVKDITQDSGSCNGGSIPSGDVKWEPWTGTVAIYVLNVRNSSSTHILSTAEVRLYTLMGTVGERLSFGNG